MKAIEAIPTRDIWAVRRRTIQLILKYGLLAFITTFMKPAIAIGYIVAITLPKRYWSLRIFGQRHEIAAIQVRYVLALAHRVRAGKDFKRLFAFFGWEPPMLEWIEEKSEAGVVRTAEYKRHRIRAVSAFNVMTNDWRPIEVFIVPPSGSEMKIDGAALSGHLQEAAFNAGFELAVTLIDASEADKSLSS